MMRAIRDNEVAAEAMGKDVTRRHLQIFIIGSAICGLAGAMMTTLDGQLTPGTYQPLRFTFLVWVMVIVGGSGNNFGAVLGGFLIWFLWVQVEPMGLWLMNLITSGMADGFCAEGAPDRKCRAYAAVHHGSGPAAGAAVQPARVDPRAVSKTTRARDAIPTLPGWGRRHFSRISAL